MTQLKALVAAMTALAMAAPLHAQDSTDTRPTVAVMYFTDGAIGKAHDDLAPLSGGISDMMISDLSVNTKIRVVERDNLKKLMDEQNLSTGGRVDQETAVKVGKLLGVHHMIFGGFVTDGRGTMRLDARAVNVETSAIEHVETVSGKQDDLLSLIDQLATKMNSGMHLPELPKTVREASAAEAKRVPFETAMLYSRALAAQDAGDKGQAVELLQRSLKSFPDYAPAQRELAKINGSQ
ncbi:MAG TPA: CsgG/HfaB family protein [Gemmatimonadaceae bacterium]|nr:CsgG/HfaB family protein [Gemmatimonadaceae bacterium]